MPYRVQRLGDLKKAPNWDVLEDCRLNEGRASASASVLTHSLVLAKPKPGGGVGGAWTAFRHLFHPHSEDRPCSIVVLLEHSQGGESHPPPAAPEVQYFHLFESHVREESSAAFEQVKDLLQIVLGYGGVSVDEGILQLIIADNGPVPLKELPHILLPWNKSGPLRHPNLQPYLDSSNGDGNLLIHQAAEGGYHESVKDLLAASSEAKQDAHEKKMSVNAQGNTPLLLAVNKGHFAAALSLLLGGAGPNVINPASGDTPLHIAARQGNADIMQALAVFDADLDVKNKAGDTALALAKKFGAESECYRLLEELVAESSRPFSDDSELQPTSPGPYLLCCDGGGVRGLVEVVLLHELERHMRLLYGSEYTALVDYFDWVAGTSTGSLVLASLVYKKMSIAELKKSYFHFKDALFHGARPLPAAETDRVAKDDFGDTQVLADVVQPKVIIPTTLADVLPPVLHMMCNYGEARQGQKGPTERKVWEAVRASSSAPTYFPAFKDKFLDGGLMANNPTLDTMAEVLKDSKTAGQPLQLGMVVSLGCGVAAGQSISDISIPHVDWWDLPEMAEAVRAALNFLKIMISQLTASNGSEVERATAWCAAMATPYIRLSPPISHISLNEVDNKKLVGMMFSALVYSRRNKDQLRKVAKRLGSRPKI